MSEQNTETGVDKIIEAGDYIDRHNVSGWDAELTDERYKALNAAPRHTQTGQEGYLLKDRETGAIHITNLDTDLSQPDYRVNAANICLTIDDKDFTSMILDDLSRAVEYDHFISIDSVRIKYTGDSGWPADVGNDDWDVVADVTPQ